MFKNDYENKCDAIEKVSIKEEKNRSKKYNNNIGKKMKKSKREK